MLKIFIFREKVSGKSALLIEGARRIGKSTIAELFAQNEYEDYLLLDFSEEEEDVLENFKNIGKPDKFFQNLFMLKGKELPPRKSAIIFDEVQLFPKARQAIKEAFENRVPLNDAIHRRMMELFRTYMAVGGMPQAVVAYIEGKSYAEIDSIKQDILTLYENDLKKYDSENREKASVIFKVIPEQLAKRNAVFKFSLIDKNARYRNYVDAVDLVAESMIGNICINVTEPDMAMELNADRCNFKLYLGDTGLFVTQMMKMENKENLYRSIIFDKISSNLGILYENMVAQMLTVAGHNLYFHEFMYQPENQVQEKKYEIDFLLTHKKRIVPIEVKSSDYRQHKSIDYLKQKYPQLKLRDKFIIYTKNLEVKDGFSYLPVYMAGLI